MEGEGRKTDIVGARDAFANAREAKEFLVERIVAQSVRDGVSLSEVERKMFYFSQTAWTLPDMAEVNEEFDSTYEQDEYERRMGPLIRTAYNALSAEEQRKWDGAVRMLKREDHYLLVLVDAAGLRPRGDLVKLVLTALLIVGVFVAVSIFFVSRN